MRSGVILRKLGMTEVYAGSGRRVPVTVLKLDGCAVVGQRRAERDGYCAVQVGAGARKPKHAARPQRKACEKAGMPLKRVVAEFRVGEEEMLEAGAEFSVAHFVPGQYVDATGVSIGKGFAGAMKRHNFGGLNATHGVSVSHRSHGSTGNSQDPGRVFKGKKMAGHMGARRVTIQNLEVVETDPERGLILVKGAAPGPRGGWLLVRDAVKRALPEDAPRPAGLAGAQKEAEKAEEQKEKTGEDGA